jgi:hypothetical protein
MATISRFGAGAPELGSAKGWPVVVYFHHIVPVAKNYTQITATNLELGLDIILQHFHPVSPQVGSLLIRREEKGTGRRFLSSGPRPVMKNYC